MPCPKDTRRLVDLGEYMTKQGGKTMYHRPVCVKCGVEMRPERNGVGILDMADYGPYQIWDADKYKCPECGYEIVVGFGCNAIAEHYQGHFSMAVE